MPLTHPVPTRFEKAVLEKAEELAARAGMTRSDLIRFAVKELVKSYEEDL